MKNALNASRIAYSLFNLDVIERIAIAQIHPEVYSQSIIGGLWLQKRSYSHFYNRSPLDVKIAVAAALPLFWVFNAKKYDDGLAQTSAHFYIIVGSANSTAYSFFIDVLDEMEDRGMLVGKGGKLAQSIQRDYDKYYGIMRKRLDKIEEYEGKDELQRIVEKSNGKANLWSDLTTQVDKLVRPEIQKLHELIQEWLIQKEYKDDVEMASACIVVGLMFDIALTVYRDYFKVAKDQWTGKDLSEEYKFANLESIDKTWDKMLDEVIKLPDNVKEIASNKKIRTQYIKILRRLSSHTIYNKAGKTALRYDKEIKKLSKEQLGLK